MLAHISKNADKRIIDALKQEGFETVLLSPFDALSQPVSSHADMLLCAVGNVIFKHSDYTLEGDFVNITEKIGAKYPLDVLLNIAIVGNHVFANVKHASKTVLDYLEKSGYSIHHVSQGYAHCSTCIVSNNAIITADHTIALTAQNEGIDVLLIGAEHISLPPYEYGFIGGATGTTNDSIYFCGSLSHHPDGENIRAFIEAHGKSVIELSNSPLSDVGGILFI